ncbi:unnamed protein product [Triticum turgidum subsp. durum]|uniref:Purine permease 11 n=1 Tax=Triticum turgidum subsp. durum TaxID=4567 RepID=A0A9R1PXW3_TRITD|nr:unnamed protein product [Triticum turgidum subsp. durum]
MSERVQWWAVVLVNIVFLLGGQSVASFLGRIYYDQGGGSLWMATLVQSCGTPLAIPLLLYFRRRPRSTAVTRPPGSDRTNSSVPEGKFPLGFALTLTASALFSLILSLMQLTFDKVLKSDTFYDVVEMQFWSNTAAAVVSVAGLFISGEWSSLDGEMDGYKKGKVAYGMTLAWTAISWQLATVGTVGLPLSPIVAVIFFGDQMDGVKVLAMLIGVWGFLSYIYQHYLDDAKVKKILAE